jgi:hypothetical protein
LVCAVAHLVAYNARLLAVMALLVGVTPVHEQDLAKKYHKLLRAGILAVAVLAALIFKPLKDGAAAWIRLAQVIFGGATVAYTVWTLFLIVAIPLLFK